MPAVRFTGQASPLHLPVRCVFSQAYPLLRPALFALNAEAAHELTLGTLQKIHDCKLTRKIFYPPFNAPACAPVTLMGLRLANRVGLAAGLDKNGAHIDALGALGFGFIEVGTVTPRAQPGNERPRLFRLPQAQALINRMGFNNQGLAAFVQNVQRNCWQAHGGVLGLNIGKNKDTPQDRAIEDYLLGLEGVYAHADYVCINISSPNTAHLRALQQADELSKLLHALGEKRKALCDAHGRNVPLVVKIAPDLDRDQLGRIAETATTYCLDGLIATNTTLARDAVANLPHADETGGLSGQPLHAQSLQVIEILRGFLGRQTAIIGVGGIMQAQQAQEKIAAGADAVQLYTGLIYRGPKLIADCVRALATPDNHNTSTLPTP